MIRIVPEAGPGSTPQPDHTKQLEHPRLGTNLPREHELRGGQSASVRVDGMLSWWQRLTNHRRDIKTHALGLKLI